MRISRDTIRAFFEDNTSRGVALHEQMLWGYFFTDRERSSLEALVPVLVSRGYHYEGISGPDDDADLHLRVERVETHTTDTLYRRCIELDELARENSVRDYDGFDVGNVDGSVLTKH